MIIIELKTSNSTLSLLFKFKNVPSPLCPFYSSAYETLLYIFYTCNMEQLWKELQYFVSHYRYIPEITPKSALFRLFNIDNQKQNLLLINHLLLIFKHFLHKSRKHGAICFTSLKFHLIKIKTMKQNAETMQ